MERIKVILHGGDMKSKMVIFSGPNGWDEISRVILDSKMPQGKKRKEEDGLCGGKDNNFI